MDFHNENKLFLVSREPSSETELGQFITTQFEQGEHPDTVALSYMTKAQEYLSVLTKDERIAHGMERVMGKFASTKP